MEFPDKFTMGPHVWKLLFVEDGLFPDSGHLAQTSMDRLVVGVDADLPRTKKLESLIHELLHAASAGNMLEDEQEEALVRIQAPNLLDLILCNKDLIEAIWAE